MLDALLLADLAAEMPAPMRLSRLVAGLRCRFRCGAVALLRLEGDHLRPVAVDGLVRETLGRRFAVSQHPRLGAILARREVTSFDHHCPLPDPYDGLVASQVGEPLSVHDCMGLSLHVDGRTWGALTLDSLQTGTFDAAARQALAHCGVLVEAAVRITRLEQDNQALRLARAGGLELHDAVPARDDSEIIGQSPALQAVLHELQVVADSELPVLLLGETGVGKELFARRLHRLSRRRSKPLVHVNCAALPESLAESELFGHMRGAFSGATADRPGRFEAADGGTLLLDEVGELPLTVQAKLLRALQNGEIQRLGTDRPRQVDVRILAATNRQLRNQVRDGHFRVDLYHRLSVYPVAIPPLREREQDVLLLAGRFLELNRARLGLRSLRLSPAAEEALLGYPWPGNVRELEHVICRAALKAVSRGAARQDIVSLPPELLDLDGPASGAEVGAAHAVSMPAQPILPLRDAVDAFQREQIAHALHAQGGQWAAAARALGLDASNLHKLARRLGMK